MYRTTGQLNSLGKALLVIFPAVFVLGVGQARASAITPEAVVGLMNVDRQESGLGQLAVDDVLTRAAEMKAADMVEHRYFAHTSPEGKDPWYWFGIAGYGYRYAGENLAIRFTNAEDEETAWMDSPSHRSNILNPKYAETGVAIRPMDEGGQPVLVVVQLFGSKAEAVLPAATERDVSAMVAKPGIRQEPARTPADSWNPMDRLESYGLDAVSAGLIVGIGFLELSSVVIIWTLLRRRLGKEAELLRKKKQNRHVW